MYCTKILCVINSLTAQICTKIRRRQKKYSQQSQVNLLYNLYNAINTTTILKHLLIYCIVLFLPLLCYTETKLKILYCTNFVPLYTHFKIPEKHIEKFYQLFYAETSESSPISVVCFRIIKKISQHFPVFCFHLLYQRLTL